MQTVEQLNTLLAQELGRNKFGEGIWSWCWSEDCFWPRMQTGRTVLKSIEVPLIGGGVERTEIPVPEYRRIRQSRKLHFQWVVTRWLSPAMLAGLHRDFKIGAPDPDLTEDYILERWRRIFPTAEYPERGVHWVTDYFNKPGIKPALDDTQFLIHQLREQLSGMSAQARLADMEAEDDSLIARKQALTEDIVEDCFTAMLNPIPGKRGGFVSWGGSDFERRIDPTGKSAWSKPVYLERTGRVAKELDLAHELTKDRKE